MNFSRIRFSMLCAAMWAAEVAIAFGGSINGTARVESSASDSTSALTWNNAMNALTVACWFKISVPSDFSLTEDMVILANNRSSNANNHAYVLFLSSATGQIEYSARGSGGTDTPIKIIERPQLERWYHVAMVRSGSVVTIYVDGRQITSTTTIAGNTNTTDGITVGGWGNAKYFRGEIQEIAIYQRALTRSENFTNMLRDIPANFPNLRGYYKLGYSSNSADNLKNFANAPAAGTENLVKQGTGTVDFPETDAQGEQSLFDSKKNHGQDAISSLGGAFSWRNAGIQRAGPGISFAFGFSYSSSIGYNGQALEQGLDVYAEDSVMGRGWRHSYQTRLIGGNLYLSGSNAYVGLLTAEGNIETWKRQTGGVFTTAHKEYRGELKEVENGDYVEWVTPDRVIHKFYHPTNWPDSLVAGRLAHVRDFNGNTVNFSYDQFTGRLTTVSDTAGGSWAFEYDGAGLLTTVSGPTSDPATKWTVTFAYTAITVAGSPVTVLSTKTLSGPASYPMPVIDWSNPAAGSTQWQFLYDSAGRLRRVNDPRGSINVEIQYDSFGRKTLVNDGASRHTGYKYNVPGLRQLTTTDHFNTGGSPDAAKDRSVVETFDRKLRLLSRKTPLGFVTSYEYDEFGNVIAQTDPRGARTVMTYDSRSNLTSRTNALGQKSQLEYNHVLTGGTPSNKPTKEIRPATAEAPNGWENRYAYDAAGNLLTHRDGPVGGADFGTLATHQYDSRGLVFSSRDANNNEARFSYDPTTGYLTSRTTAFGTPQAATWIFTHTELGWPKSETNPLSETTTLAYNINGQVISTTDAIGRIFTKAHDSNGNLVSESDGNGRITTYDYNGVNERTKKTDRDGNTSTNGSYRDAHSWFYGYNTFGELMTVLSPPVLSDGNTQSDTITNAYDLDGRLVSITDPYGKSVTQEYDANGNQTAMVDKVGKRWQKEFDALNRVIAQRDPEGNVRITSFDADGRILVVKSPNGFISTHEYDGRGRLTKWMDPEGFQWIYSYDGVGNILDIEDALHGHYVMEYGPRNERLKEKNQDNKEWTYTYDALVRLKTQTNPPGMGAGPGGGPVIRTFFYDAAGRLESVSFNTGRTNVLSYDNNNNVRTVIRTGGGLPVTSLALDYDVLDRLEESRDAFGKTVRYSYDVRGRVVTKIYPGGKPLTHSYDRLGRLEKLSFAFSGSPLDCTFAYDDEGRITDRTYPNGLSQNNTFDDAGRIKSLDHKQGAASLIAMTYAYDHNGNKTGGDETGTVNWQPGAISDYDETTSFTPAGQLIQRTDANPNPDVTMSYSYDAAGNMTGASTNLGETYSLAYDEDNRTTSIHWDMGLASKQITNRYDALGRRISRTLDGIETRYVLDLLGDMERILCDTDATGTITAWYVHGPDLCFKVTDSGALTCYHTDAQGNIVRTTNATGSTVNQYAYTPYGRSLESAVNAPDSDPYRFVGSQGVMLEIPGLYFMRARYYSADAAVFLATDPVKSFGADSNFNAYGYARGNPGSNSDPDGNWPSLSDWIFQSAAKDVAGLSPEAEAAYWDAWIGGIDTTIERTIDATENAVSIPISMFTGNIKGAVANGVDLVGNLATSLGYEKIGKAADVAKFAYDVYDVGTDLKDAYDVTSNFGQVTRRLGEATDKGSAFMVGLLQRDTIYGNVPKTLFSAGIKGAVQKSTEWAAGGNKGQNSNSGSLANKTVGAGTYAAGTNTKQSASGSSSALGKLGKALSTAKSTVTSIIKAATASTKSVTSKAVTAVKSAVSRAVGAVKSFFGGGRKK